MDNSPQILLETNKNKQKRDRVRPLNREIEYHFVHFSIPRFIVSYIFLLAIGIGSWMFHMTLQYEMQLMDELPMVYACAVFVYCLFEVRQLPPFSESPIANQL